MDFASIVTLMSYLMNRVQSQPDAADMEKIAQLGERIMDLKMQLSELTKQTGRIEKDIKALQTKILEIGGVRLRTQQSKVQDIKEMIEHTSTRRTKAEVAKSKAEKDLAKLEQTLATNTENLKDLEQELMQVEKSIREKSRAAETIRSQVEEARLILKDKIEELDEMKSALDRKIEGSYQVWEASGWYFNL